MAYLDRFPPPQSGVASDLDPFTSEYEREARRRELAARDRFLGLYAEWLRNVAQSTEGFGDEDIPFQHSDREDELARLIATTPAVYPWMVFYKFNVLERYVGDPENDWTDRREVVLLSGIKADLLRFGIGETR